MNYTVIREDELYHHGILGMKWGVRRYQNEDGSLTPEGRKRYYSGEHTGGTTELEKLAYDTAHTKAGNKRTKRFKKYELKAYKEEEDAYKRGDVDEAKKIAAGRTYMRILADSQYFQMSINHAANTAAAVKGQKVIESMMSDKGLDYEIKRNDKRGGVDITVAGVQINITDSNHLYEQEEKESKRKTTVHTNEKAARRSESSKELDQRKEDVLKKNNVSKAQREKADKIAVQLTTLRNRKDKETLSKMIKEYSKDYDVMYIPSEERYVLTPKD